MKKFFVADKDGNKVSDFLDTETEADQHAKVKGKQHNRILYVMKAVSVFDNDGQHYLDDEPEEAEYYDDNYDDDVSYDRDYEDDEYVATHYDEADYSDEDEDEDESWDD